MIDDPQENELERLRVRVAELERSARKRERDAVREQVFRVFDQAPWGLAIADFHDDRFVFVNPAFAKMHEATPEELIGAPIASVYPPNERVHLDARRARIEDEGNLTFETTHLRSSGETFPVRVTVTVARDEQGTPAWRAAQVVDLTEQVAAQERTLKLEDQLRQSQKLEAVGLLASGIAHDFNNHLTVILGCAELLRDELHDEDLINLAGSITNTSNAAAQVTNQLLAFAREQPRQERVVDVNLYLKATVELLQRLLPEDIALTAGLWEDPLHIRADPAQLEQVVLNLALNARDAMTTAGGQLRIRTGREEDAALLEVQDTGLGMTPEVLARIYEPFFSTKPTVKGTGLGLATVHGIIEQNSWTLRVESEPGVGTTFRLWIPIAKASPPPVTRSVPAEPRQARILVAEDDSGVAEVVCKSLRVAGHEVMHAVDGVDALDRLANSGPFDLLVSDVMMPRMRGGSCSRMSGGTTPTSRSCSCRDTPTMSCGCPASGSYPSRSARPSFRPWSTRSWRGNSRFPRRLAGLVGPAVDFVASRPGTVSRCQGLN